MHAIAAVVAGQGVSILSDVVVAQELESGALVKALDLAIPGLGFYLVHTPGHPRQAMIDKFHAWMMSREPRPALPAMNGLAPHTRQADSQDADRHLTGI